MIPVDRARVPVPEMFTAPEGRAAAERLANDALAAQGQHGEMKFRAYKHPSVMPALTALFQGKCAYCESRYVAQQPGDVEHFRPKGSVVVRQADGTLRTLPGYHWLAAEWSNLMPSCADCNRPRRHQVRDGQTQRVLGKANWFPVDPEANRATRADLVDAEPRLLIDPTLDDPGAHLAFDEDGTIHPLEVQGQPSARGEATIEYCGLERLGLTQERHKRGLDVLYVLASLVNALARADSVDVQRHAAQLRTMVEPAAPYAAYARTLVQRQLAGRQAIGL